MKDENVRIAWNAAYWLLRSEARRQVRSKLPDCDWKMVEANDECVATIIEAQAKICMQAMQSVISPPADPGPLPSARQYSASRSRIG